MEFCCNCNEGKQVTQVACKHLCECCLQKVKAPFGSGRRRVFCRVCQKREHYDTIKIYHDFIQYKLDVTELSVDEHSKVAQTELHRLTAQLHRLTAQLQGLKKPRLI